MVDLIEYLADQTTDGDYRNRKWGVESIEIDNLADLKNPYGCEK